MADDVMEKIVSLAKRRGFIYPGSEIYGGLKGTWDYGPLGVELKNNIKALWWRMFVQNRDDMYGMDAAIIMNPKAWEASGHVSGFADPLVECSNCHYKDRVDKLIEDQAKYRRFLSYAVAEVGEKIKKSDSYMDDWGSLIDKHEYELNKNDLPNEKEVEERQK
jgi:glycyl-tRNA synthetase (class II)